MFSCSFSKGIINSGHIEVQHLILLNILNLDILFNLNLEEFYDMVEHFPVISLLA